MFDEKFEPRCTLSDDEIAAMFLKGIDAEAIGMEAGITRERVRQRLNRYFRVHPDKFPQGHNEQETAEILKVSSSYLAKLRKIGRVVPRRLGRTHIYSEELIESLRDAVAKYCRTCGRIIPKGQYHFCEVCRKQKERTKYASMSDEAKKRHQAVCKEWKDRHPEKLEIYKAKAKQALEIRRRERSIYTVITNNAAGISIGTEVKVVGYNRPALHLILDDGRELHNRCVRRTLR